MIPIKVDLTEDGKKVVILINRIRIELFEQQVNELIQQLEEKKWMAKANLNGWIATATVPTSHIFTDSSLEKDGFTPITFKDVEKMPFYK